MFPKRKQARERELKEWKHLLMIASVFAIPTFLISMVFMFIKPIHKQLARTIVVRCTLTRSGLL